MPENDELRERTPREKPNTETEVRSCPHCREIHEVSVVREPGWEAIVYCPRTGEAG